MNNTWSVLPSCFHSSWYSLDHVTQRNGYMVCIYINCIVADIEATPGYKKEKEGKKKNRVVVVGEKNRITKDSLRTLIYRR